MKTFLPFSPDLRTLFTNTLLRYSILASTCLYQPFYIIIIIILLASPACKYRIWCNLIFLQLYMFKQWQVRLGSIQSPSPTEAVVFCDHPNPRKPATCCFLSLQRSTLYNTKLCTAWLLVPADACERFLKILYLHVRHHASRAEMHLNTCRMRWKLSEGVETLQHSIALGFCTSSCYFYMRLF